jgi:hypothetical protein
LYLWCHGNRRPRASWRSFLWLKTMVSFFLLREAMMCFCLFPYTKTKRCIRLLYWNRLLSLPDTTLIHIFFMPKRTTSLIWWGGRWTTPLF